MLKDIRQVIKNAVKAFSKMYAGRVSGLSKTYARRVWAYPRRVGGPTKISTILLVLLSVLIVSPVYSAGKPLEVKELDGSPSKKRVNTVVVPNDSLTISGNTATLSYASSGDLAAYINKDGTVALTADWDAGTFDISAKSLIGSTSTTAVSASSAGEMVIFVTNTDAERTITLDTDEVVAGQTIIIKDMSGNAGTNNIIIDTEAAETIDGAASIRIIVDYGCARLACDGTNWGTG